VHKYLVLVEYGDGRQERSGGGLYWIGDGGGFLGKEQESSRATERTNLGINRQVHRSDLLMRKGFKG